MVDGGSRVMIGLIKIFKHSRKGLPKGVAIWNSETDDPPNFGHSVMMYRLNLPKRFTKLNELGV